MKPGDWKCDDCGNVVFGDKGDKSACGICKKKQNIYQGQFLSKRNLSGSRANDWTCIKCNNHVFYNKIKCGKCNEPKSDSLVNSI